MNLKSILIAKSLDSNDGAGAERALQTCFLLTALPSDQECEEEDVL